MDTVDYGPDHQKKCLAQWNSDDKAIISKVARIWVMQDETDTSILEFCFNYNFDFKKNLCYFKTNEIRNVFRSQCAGKSETLSEFFDHIKIVSMKDGKVELQFWYYFPRVQNVVYNENDTEDDIREKEWEQEKREREAEAREREVYLAHETLLKKTGAIVDAFQQALYRLFGVLFKKENITFLEEPDFTYEGPSLVERLECTAGTVRAYVETTLKNVRNLPKNIRDST